MVAQSKYSKPDPPYCEKDPRGCPLRYAGSRYCGQGDFDRETLPNTEGKGLHLGSVCFTVLLGSNFNPGIIKTREEENEGETGIKLQQPSLLRAVDVNSEKTQTNCGIIGRAIFRSTPNEPLLLPRLC